MSSDDIIIIKNIMTRIIIIITIKYEYEYDNTYHDHGYKNCGRHEDKMDGSMMIMKYSGLMTTIIMAPAERAKCLLQVLWHHHHHHHHHHHLYDISHFNHHFHDDDDDVRKGWKLGELSSDQKTSS